MNIRAVIFDIYGTLLEVGLPPPDADRRWRSLCRDLLHLEPRLSRMDFTVAASQVIARRHEAARARGIRWPEIDWPSVVAEVLPELAQLTPPEQAEFLYRQIQIGHSTHMSAEAAATLGWLKERAGLLGIASNAQAYTLRELREALAVHSLALELFERDLSFWSFEHGFSKPDPHVFQILTARLGARGIAPSEILMIGDRLDSDLEPARAHGWRTWQAGAQADGWAALREWLHEPQPTSSA